MIRYFKLIILTIGILISNLPLIEAQFKPAVVDISDQKIIFMGKMYYVHTVKQGQTLFSICKAYNVTEEDIQKANPDALLKPLSVGLALRIPFAQESDPDTEDISPEPLISDDFIFHTVLPKQTPYFLHKKYNIPLEVIYHYNPGTENGLQAGQIIRIPKKRLVENQAPREIYMQEDVIHYEVRPGDTLYRIAEQYGVTISALVEANKSLRWGLKAGQIIMIPTKQTASLLASLSKQDSILLVTAMTGFTSWQCDSIRMQKRMRPPTKVAILLPFFAREGLAPDTSTVLIDSISGKQIKTKPKPFMGRGASEFYEGFLLAVDSLRRTGFNISLFVYDTEGDTNRINKILNELDIVEPDLIFGPFFADNVRLTSKYAFEHKIPFIPPLMKGDTTILNNPYLFQVHPSEETEFITQAKYLSHIHPYNILYLYHPSVKNHDKIVQFRQLLTNYLTLQTRADTLLITDLIINDSLNYNLSQVLRKDTLNYAIVFSSYEPEVINSLSQLNYHLREFPIKVFGQPEWQTFPNVRIDHFHDLEVAVYSPFFIDYTSPHVKRFVTICRNKLNYEPYKTTSRIAGLNYTFLGYDLGMYFLTSSYYYGKEVCNCVSHYSPTLLLTTYHFSRNSSTGCFENDYINFIRYTKEYEIIEEHIEAVPR